MKRLFLTCVLLFIATFLNAQRCAVLDFKANVGISQNDVDGISSIFTTYFHPEGCTLVERTQVDKIIEEQGFQRSQMTQSQMVRVGQILNVSHIVVGDVNVVFGQYQVDVRIVNVETGSIDATEGATFTPSTYRSCMQDIAQKLAKKISFVKKVKVDCSKYSNEKDSQFLCENMNKAGVEVSPSGLQYEVVRMGTGAKPIATDKVKVHYKGTLLDGTVFDSSYDRGEPITFTLNGVIAGWQEGLQLMPVGSIFILYIPSVLAYGKREVGGKIPAGSTLIFEVELLDIQQ